jgi:hypothetical protein
MDFVRLGPDTRGVAGHIPLMLCIRYKATKPDVYPWEEPICTCAFAKLQMSRIIYDLERCPSVQSMWEPLTFGLSQKPGGRLDRDKYRYPGYSVPLE